MPLSVAADPDAAAERVLAYDLTADDLAAWIAGTRAERRALRGRIASALLAAVMGLQFVAGRLPIPPGPAAATAEAAAILILPMFLAWWTWRRGHSAQARDDLPKPVQVQVAVWPDRLVETRSDRTQPQIIRPRMLHRVELRRGRLVGETETARLILPRAAFANEQDQRDFAARLAAAQR